MSNKNNSNLNNSQIGDHSNVHIGDDVVNNNIIKKPIAFDPEKFKSIIEKFLDSNYLRDVISTGEEQYSNFYRNIEKKNEMNGVSKEYFEFINSDCQEHFSDINKFLQSPINREINKRYHLIARKLNINYVSLYKKEKNLPEHIQFIQEKVYNELGNSISDDVDFYISIFLHHMYFYCEYGINPQII